MILESEISRSVLILCIALLAGALISCGRIPRKPPPGIEWGMIYDAESFTKNDNKKFPLLWSKRWALSVAAGTGKCIMGEDTFVEPDTIVFVKFDDEVTADIEVGTQATRRTLRRGSKPSALRFRSLESKKPGEFRITGREQLVICNNDRETVILVEARKYRR